MITRYRHLGAVALFASSILLPTMITSCGQSSGSNADDPTLGGDAATPTDGGTVTTGDTSSNVDLNGAFIEQIDGVRVLHLFGSPKERGIAHGYLLAEEVVGVAQRYLFDFAVKSASLLPYVKVRELLEKNAYWPPSSVAELEGVLEGIRAKLPPDKRLVTIPNEEGPNTREIDLTDLKAGATIDWTRIGGCSGFAAWGKATGGPTIHARNLDVASGNGALFPHLLVAAVTPDNGAPRWASLIVAGQIGCGTCMNEHGLTMEGNNGGDSLPSTRSTEIIGRQILAALNISQHGKTPEATLTDVVATQRQYRTYVSHNSFYTTPYGTGKPDDQVAAVLESDGNDFESGTTQRKPSETSISEIDRTDMIIVTNHMLKRVSKATAAEDSVLRYQKIWERMQIATNPTHPENPTKDAIIDATDAQWIMQAVGVDDTLAFAIFEPDALKIHVTFQSKLGVPAPSQKVTALTWSQLFKN